MIRLHGGAPQEEDIGCKGKTRGLMKYTRMIPMCVRSRKASITRMKVRGYTSKQTESNGEVWIQGKKQEWMDGETKKDESVPMDG